MKRVFILSALLFAAATPRVWGQTYYSTPSAYGQNLTLAEALIGTWELYHDGAYSGNSVTTRYTFYSDGTYEYMTTIILSMGDYSNSSETNDQGIWQLRGNTLYMRSSLTGEQLRFQLQVIQSDALYANEQTWLKQ